MEEDKKTAGWIKKGSVPTNAATIPFLLFRPGLLSLPAGALEYRLFSIWEFRPPEKLCVQRVDIALVFKNEKVPI